MKFLIAILIHIGFASWTEAASFSAIGTGGATGIYFPTGQIIAKLTNRSQSKYKLSVENTGGSVANINGVLSGDYDFGFAQSDILFDAYRGKKKWKDQGAKKNLRTLFSTFTEAFTVVAAVDSGIKTLRDLKGKKVNIGNPGSGVRDGALRVLKHLGWDPQKDIQAESLHPGESARMLQDGRIDAFFMPSGHPNGMITEATTGKRKVTLLQMKEILPMLKGSPYFAKALLGPSLYPLAVDPKNVETIGVKAVFFTREDVSEELAYSITKAVFENLEKIQKTHPALGRLTKEKMKEALTAPIHPGAKRYFDGA